MTYRFNNSSYTAKPHRRLALATLVCLALLGGSTGIKLPSLEGTVTLGAAWAQDSGITAEEATNYAASVLQMDSPRNEAFSQIKTLLTGTSYDVASIDMSCTGTDSLNQLPRNLRNSVRTVVVNYCNQASTIVQANGLTVRRFNAITAAHPQDPALAEQIRAAMVQLQQQSQGSRPANSTP
jgi:hypothetical protein